MRFERLSVAVMMIAAFFGCAPDRSSVESGVLRSDWEAVHRRMSGHLAPSSPLLDATLLRAHAALALNRGNDAVCAFGAASDEDLQRWDRWTATFLRAHDRDAVAHYLRGDALARVGQMSAAKAEMDRAVALDGRSALAYHARGVLRGIAQDAAGGDADLRQAIASDATFAAAMTSRGFARLDDHQADAAITAFESALKAEPDFVLAEGGRAYASAVLQSNPAGSENPPRVAIASGSCAGRALATSFTGLVAWLTDETTSEEPISSETPGTTMDRNLGRLQNGDLKALGPIARTLAEHPQYRNQVENTLRQIQKSNPALYRDVTERASRNLAWVQPGGGADTALNTLKSFSYQRGGLTFHPAPLIREQASKQTRDYQGGQTINRMLNQNPIGGVSSSLALARVDLGDWPTPRLNALLYRGGGR